MEPTNYRRIVELVDAVLELEPPMRGELLDRECLDQPGLRSEVESLLAENEAQDDQFLATPAALELAHFVGGPARRKKPELHRLLRRWASNRMLK